MKKLQTRMLVLILLPALLLLIGLTAYVSFTVNKIAIDNAEEMLLAHGEALSGELRLGLEESLHSVRTVSQSFAGLLENGITPEREQANIMLQQLLLNNGNLLTAWMFWEENAFDGKDAEYINLTGHDHTGRFLPVWSQTGNGQLIVEPLTGYDVPGALLDNFNHVFATGENVIFEPFTYVVDGKEVLMTSIVAPVVVNGKTLGMTGVDISLDELNTQISEFSFYDNGFAGLMSNEGNVLSHQNEELIGMNYFESAAMVERDDNEEVRGAVKRGETAQITGFSHALKTDVYRLFTPIHIDGITTPWSAFLAAPVNEVTAEAKKLTTVIILINIAVAAFLAFIIFIVTRNITSYIREAVAHGSEMANGDFTKEVQEKHLKRQDELGDLARIFFTISKNMRVLIRNVQTGSEQVLKSSQSVEEGTSQATLAANEVAMSIEEVARSAESQMQSAEESAKAMEEMSQGVQQVANGATTVSEVANEMAQQADMSQKTVQNAVSQMDRIKNTTEETQKIILKLQAEAERIGSIVTMITDISEQTNLLALNAAIEAARAGESGKGFAVVADEVRKLADETKNSAMNIQQLLEVTQEDTAQAANFMNVSTREVNEGISRIEEVGEAFEQIISFIERVDNEIEELSAVAEEMSAMSEEIVATSEEIASSAEVSSGHTDQVAAASEEQLASMEEMTKAAQSLNVLANDLSELLNQFKVPEEE